MEIKDLYVLAGSLAVISVMVGFAALLGFRQSARIASEADLATLIAENDPGARIEAAAIDEAGRAALARLTDGRLVVARAMGDSISLRSYAAGAVQLRVEGDKLSATFGDLGFPAIHIRLKDPAPWARGMGGQA